MNEALRQMIVASAGQLGISPLDLATVISYETAGTFDPMVKGPTTQWGQHKGLIQWGEPQAQKYLGGDFSIPTQGQGIVAYMKDAGVQPGMGLLDVYSAVNAGRVGRYNASDANNGGAPGTVRDKVEDQMAGHRAKAQALLGSPEQEIGGDSLVPRSYPGLGPASTFSNPSPLATGGVLADANPLPAGLGAYWAGDEKKTLGERLAAAGKALAQAVPDAPSGHLGGGGNARATGGMLAEALQNRGSLAEALFGKRTRGIL